MDQELIREAFGNKSKVVESANFIANEIINQTELNKFLKDGQESLKGLNLDIRDDYFGVSLNLSNSKSAIYISFRKSNSDLSVDVSVNSEMESLINFSSSKKFNFDDSVSDVIEFFVRIINSATMDEKRVGSITKDILAEFGMGMGRIQPIKQTCPYGHSPYRRQQQKGKILKLSPGGEMPIEEVEKGKNIDEIASEEIEAALTDIQKKQKETVLKNENDRHERQKNTIEKRFKNLSEHNPDIQEPKKLMSSFRYFEILNKIFD